MNTFIVYADSIINPTSDNNNSITMRNWVNDFTQWYNATLGTQTEVLEQNSVQKFFTTNAVWINNDATLATSLDGFMHVYANQINSKKSYIIQTPLTEFISTSNYVILRYQIIVNLPMGVREFHQVMTYVHFAAEGKADKIVELDRTIGCH